MFECRLFLRMRIICPCLRVYYSCGSGELPVFECTLFVRERPNSQCVRVRYSCGCVRIDRVCVYAVRAYTDE